jgi:DNA-damage-inducible protein J
MSYDEYMKDSVVRARVDSDLKTETEIIFSKLGITTTEAIRMFLAQVKLKKGLPFSIDVPEEFEDDLLITSRSRQAAIDTCYDD